MSNTWPSNPWIAPYQRGEIGFALGAYPLLTPADHARHLLAAGQLAEDLGFDAFFIGDHPAVGLDCWLHLAALARSTERVRLGPHVACNGYRPPVLTARLAADLDNLSNGRAVLGLGIGVEAGEFASLSLPFPPTRERQEALAEAIAIIRGVWGDQPFIYDGAHYQIPATRIAPPPRQARLPLLIAGGGERVTLRQVAELADACNLDSVHAPTVADVERKLAALRRHCEAIGRPYETVLRTQTTGWLILAPDEARLAKKVARYQAAPLELPLPEVPQSFLLAATPEQAVAHYLALAEAGIQYFIAHTLDAADTETIHLLGKEVMPRLHSAAPATA